MQLDQTVSQALAGEGVELYNSTEVNKWVKDMIGSRDLLSSRNVQIGVDGEPTEATLSVTLEVEGREGVATLRLYGPPATS